jgi:hypothetical protein
MAGARLAGIFVVGLALPPADTMQRAAAGRGFPGRLELTGSAVFRIALPACYNSPVYPF